MKWVYKLERKYPNFGIQNLMMFIIIGQAMVALTELIAPDIRISTWLMFSWHYILQGQIWRIFTFIFVPMSGLTIFGTAITLYLYYFIGSNLENTWGTVRFNVYYWCGVLGSMLAGILAAQIWPGAYITVYYLHLSLFLAFAALHPDMQLMLFFVLPIKIKYLGYAAGAYLVLMFLLRGWTDKLTILFSLINFLLFFGGSFWRKARQEYSYRKNRKNWQRQNMR